MIVHFDSLGLRDAKLSAKRYWQGVKFQVDWGEREAACLYLTLRCHHQIDSAFEMEREVSPACGFAECGGRIHQ